MGRLGEKYYRCRKSVTVRKMTVLLVRPTSMRSRSFFSWRSVLTDYRVNRLLMSFCFLSCLGSVMGFAYLAYHRPFFLVKKHSFFVYLKKRSFLTRSGADGQKEAKNRHFLAFSTPVKSKGCVIRNPRAISGHFQIGREICQNFFFRALYAILGPFPLNRSPYSEKLFGI